MPEPPGSISQRLDRIERLQAELAEQLAELRTELVRGTDLCPADEPETMIEVSTAVERFNRPADTLRYWCRQGCGKKIGGRWLASPRAIRRKLNGE